MKTITIEFNDLGGIKIEADGFPSKSCLDTLAEFEKHFGSASKKKLKAEGYRNKSSCGTEQKV